MFQRVPSGFSVESKDRCIHNVAVKNKNVAVCNRLDNEGKDRCFGGVAYALQDESICASISDERARNECQSNIIAYKDYDCSELWDNVKRDFCYMGRCQSVVCCNNIKGLPESDMRRNNCLARIGGQSGDFSLCIQAKDRKCILNVIE